MKGGRRRLQPILAMGLGMSLAAGPGPDDGGSGFKGLGLRAGTLFFDPQQNAGSPVLLGAQGTLVFEGGHYGLSLDGYQYQAKSSVLPGARPRYQAYSASFLTGLSDDPAATVWPYLGLGLGTLRSSEIDPLTFTQTTSRTTTVHASLGFVQRCGTTLFWGVEGRAIFRLPSTSLQEIQASLLLGYAWGGRTAVPPPPPAASLTSASAPPAPPVPSPQPQAQGPASAAPPVNPVASPTSPDGPAPASETAALGSAPPALASAPPAPPVPAPQPTAQSPASPPAPARPMAAVASTDGPAPASASVPLALASAAPALPVSAPQSTAQGSASAVAAARPIPAVASTDGAVIASEAAAIGFAPPVLASAPAQPVPAPQPQAQGPASAVAPARPMAVATSTDGAVTASEAAALGFAPPALASAAPALPVSAPQSTTQGPASAVAPAHPMAVATSTDGAVTASEATALGFAPPALASAPAPPVPAPQPKAQGPASAVAPARPMVAAASIDGLHPSTETAGSDSAPSQSASSPSAPLEPVMGLAAHMASTPARPVPGSAPGGPAAGPVDPPPSSAETVPLKVAPTDSSAEDRLAALRRGDILRALDLSRAYLETLPAQHWTLRLEAARLDITLKNAAWAYPGRPDLFLAPLQLRDGRRIKQLFLGVYASRAEAERTLRAVPAFFLRDKLRPFPIQVSDIPARACPMTRPVPRPRPVSTSAPKGIPVRGTASCTRCHGEVTPGGR